MKIALQGIETAIRGAFSYKEGIPQLIRYADDLVVLHPTEAGVQKAKHLLETWLSTIGLELKPSKTKITHTLYEYQGHVGFDFLGWTIRQFPVGKTHTGKNPRGKAPGFKTIITPSKEAVKRHLADMKVVIDRNRHAPQEKLISQHVTLWKHGQAHVQRHIKVKGAASPYDGDLLYWSQRLKTHPMFNGVKGALLRKQQGKCRWCELLFQDTDVIEIDHITPTSQGGGEALSNKCLLHRHCHDERHAQQVNGISDKDPIIEEPDAGKLACPVLKPSGGGDPFA